MVILLNRKVSLADDSEILITWLWLMSSRMTVDPDPAPMMLIPLDTESEDVHVQFPEGTLIVSPSTATCAGPLMTAFTSL